MDYPDSIKHAQTNWIGKSEGALIKFPVDGHDLEVFTTRPDTLFGTTFVAIAPEHPILETLVGCAPNRPEVLKYIEKAKNTSDLERQTAKEKTGVKLEGVTAGIPFDKSGREVPVFVADYILMGYGTGAIMGVPGHDERDFEFAKTHGLEVIKVVEPQEPKEMPYPDEGTAVNSFEYTGLSTQEFKQKIIEQLEKDGLGKPATTYKLRDWVFSRQRYWGEPIPMIHKQDGTPEPIADPDNWDEVMEKLPLTLPEVPNFNPLEDGTSPIAKNAEWLNTTDKEGNPAKREIDTMPNWAGSSWYYIRFVDPENNDWFADYEKMKYWLPVDRYFGGSEHTTLHLLYSRFWHKFLFDQGKVPVPEPYAWRLNGGLLLGPDGKKMSKSLGNIVNPTSIVENYGADALRMYICFLGPYEDTYPWNDNGIKSTWRLLKNVWALRDKVKDVKRSPGLEKDYHKAVKNITEMIESLKMNTAISQLMIFVNKMKSVEHVDPGIWKGFVKLLAPFAPFIAEELWQDINGWDEWDKNNSVHLDTWPTFDEGLTKDKTFMIPVQINGKLKGEVEVTENEPEVMVREKVFALSKVSTLVGDENNVKDFIYVPNRIVNIVV